MRYFIKMLLVLLSTFPCYLICACDLAVCVIGFAYTGVWMMCAYSCLEAKEAKEVKEEE